MPNPATRSVLRPLVRVEVQPVTDCDGCGVRSECGIGCLSRAASRSRHVFAQLDQGVPRSREVTIILLRNRVLVAGLIGYGVPLLGLLGGGWMVPAVTPLTGDAGTALGSVGGLLAAALILRAAGQRLRTGLIPRVLPVPDDRGGGQ